MACKNCEKLRKKLSPLEDREFTTKFLAQQPLSWMQKQIRTRRGAPVISLKLPSAWHATFGTEGNNHELTVLGRSLQALGWERRVQDGANFFQLSLAEFGEYANEHRTRSRK